MFSGIKDTLTSTAAKSFLASRIERYGRLTDIRIHSKEKSMSAEIVLVGESVPVTLEIGKYHITGTSGNHALVVDQVKASRPWLQNLLEDVLLGKPLPIPSLALIALGKVDDVSGVTQPADAMSDSGTSSHL